MSAISNRNCSGGGELETMLSFLESFLLDQYWKEQVFLEVASLLASGTDLGVWCVVFLGLFRNLEEGVRSW